MLNGNATIVLLTVGLIKKDMAKMSEHFSDPKSLAGRVKIELDLYNYATKADLKNATGVDTSKFAKKVDLASLKSNVPTNLNNLKREIDKLDSDKLVPVSVDLSKLRNVVKMMLLKKMYIMLR